MTAAAKPPFNEYVENGVTTVFAAKFRFNDPAHIACRRIALDGSVTNLAIGVDFSVSGGSTDAGGTVTVAAPASAGVRLQIRRRTPRVQAMNYATSDTFPAESHEAALDKAMLVDQEQDEAIDDVTSRALMVPVGEAAQELPAQGTRQGRFLGFDAMGRPIASVGTGADEGLRLDLADPDIGGVIVALRRGTIGDAVDWVTPAMFLIPDDGDPDEDVTAELLQMIDFANLVGWSVRFGPRKYISSAMLVFETSVEGAGSGLSRIQSVATGPDDYVAKVMGRGTFFRNIALDGGVSADPGAWSAGNYDSFTGAQGLLIDADYVEVSNVVSSNTRRAGFKVEQGRIGVQHRNCRAQRCRGVFGDGFIAIAAKGVGYESCEAEDFTRIGFVADAYGDSAGTYCDGISYRNCEARNGHDASIFYGGGEYNSGFWAEQSCNISADNCRAIGTGSRGFVGTAGPHLAALIGPAEYVYTGCRATGVENGFINVGLGGVPVKATLTGCFAEITGSQAYSAGGLADDIVYLKNCSSILGGANGARVSVRISLGSVVIDGFKESWATLSTALRDDPAQYYGSVSHFADAPTSLKVTDFKTFFGGVQTFSVFKFLDASAGSLDLQIDRTWLRGVAIACKKLTTSDVRWQRFGSIDAPKISIRGGSTTETDAIFSLPLKATTEEILFEGVYFDLLASGASLHLFNVSNVDPWSKIAFERCRVRKDFATNNRFLLLDGVAGPMVAADANHIVANNSIFINTGGATANPIFVIDSASDPAGKLHGVGNRMSATLSVPIAVGKQAAGLDFAVWG